MRGSSQAIAVDGPLMEHTIEILLLEYGALKGNKRGYIIFFFIQEYLHFGHEWKDKKIFKMEAEKIKGMRTDVSCPYIVIM